LQGRIIRKFSKMKRGGEKSCHSGSSKICGKVERGGERDKKIPDRRIFPKVRNVRAGQRSPKKM